MPVVEAAQILALEAELALERERCRRLEAQLRNLADHDPLTDLLNRRSFERELEEHVAGCTRYGPEGALLLVGLDGVDDVACALGQWATDEAVAGVAQRVVGRLRETDVVGRWGPAELAVLLPRASPSEVVVVADALVGIVGRTETPRVPPGALLASIGVVLVVATPVEAAGLLRRAAEASDAARRAGGGRWLLAEG